MAKDKQKNKETEFVSKSLAVKYRPRKLDDLLGQDAVVAKLRGVFSSKKIPAGFLIVGGTGRGKTTTARMIARHINCKTLDSCGKCENCESFGDSGEAHPDYEEINVADERGIDDLRAIIRKSINRPRLGKFRVILLDECHQLTPQAAEVLLKPLEEPPPATVWILGTTDPEKLKQTVVKRLMPLKMLPIDKAVVEKRIKQIARKEDITLKDKVFDKIAEASAGHMRDAIQLLESCQASISGGRGKTSELLLMIDEDSHTSSDKDLETLAVNMCLALLALSLTSFWKTMTMLKGEEVALANKAIYLLQYVLEDSTGIRGPFVWHTPLNRRFKERIRSELRDFNLKKFHHMARATSALDLLVSVRNQLVSSSGSPRSLIIARLGSWIEARKRAEH